MSKVRVLVTGAGGFIGRHLCRRLMMDPGISHLVRLTRQLMDGHFLLSNLRHFSGLPVVEDCNCDLTNESAVKAIMESYQPQVVFHLAANPIIKADTADPCRISRENIMATHHLLAHCREGTRFVLASSAAVYGDNATTPAVEHQVASPNSVYGATKVAAEALVAAHPVRGVSLRLVANVGAGATHGVVRDLARKLLSDAPELEILGDEPGSLKPYMHVSDTVEAFYHLGLNMDCRGPWNIANDDQLTSEQLAHVLMDALGVRKPIRWLGAGANWRGDNRTVRVDSTRARRLGWSPQFSRSADAVRQGVLDMVRYTKDLA